MNKFILFALIFCATYTHASLHMTIGYNVTNNPTCEKHTNTRVVVKLDTTKFVIHLSTSWYADDWYVEYLDCSGNVKNGTGNRIIHDTKCVCYNYTTCHSIKCREESGVDCVIETIFVPEIGSCHVHHKSYNSNQQKKENTRSARVAFETIFYGMSAFMVLMFFLVGTAIGHNAGGGYIIVPVTA